jgi:hypothetical protein
MRALYGAISEILLPVDDSDIDLTAYFTSQRQYIEQIIEDHRREMRYESPLNLHCAVDKIIYIHFFSINICFVNA